RASGERVTSPRHRAVRAGRADPGGAPEPRPRHARSAGRVSAAIGRSPGGGGRPASAGHHVVVRRGGGGTGGGGAAAAGRRGRAPAAPHGWLSADVLQGRRRPTARE